MFSYVCLYQLQEIKSEGNSSDGSQKDALDLMPQIKCEKIEFGEQSENDRPKDNHDAADKIDGTNRAGRLNHRENKQAKQSRSKTVPQRYRVPLSSDDNEQQVERHKKSKSKRANPTPALTNNHQHW